MDQSKERTDSLVSTGVESQVGESNASSSSSDFSLLEADEEDLGRLRRSSSSSSLLNQPYVDSQSIFELLNPSHAELSLKNTYNKVKNSRTTRNLTSFTKKQKDKILNTTHEIEIDKLKSNVLKRLDVLNDKLSGTLQTSKIEKLFYSFSIYAIFMCGIIIGKYPLYFHVFYTFLSAVLLPIRYLTYWKTGYGYFLVDLCYYVNVLLLSFIWIFPHSRHLFIVCFAFTFGTLSWAVITWRNSLVLHSIEKTTSLFIHITPPVVVYVIAHQLPESYVKERFPGAASVENWNLVGGILWTSLYYLIWQSLYHYFITIKRADKIKAGRVTSFSWLRKSYASQPIGKFVNSLPEPFPVLAFTLIQYMYQLLTMLLCPIWFKYKFLATAFMSFIFIWSSYNGATYYIDIFGKKFEKEVFKLREEISLLQDRNQSRSELSEDSQVTS